MVLALAALCAAVVAPSAASAQEYPPPAVSVPPKAVAGQAVPFSGTGFKPNSTVTISVTYSGSNSTAGFRAAESGQMVLAGLPVPKAVIKDVLTDATGAFSTSITLTQAGLATITGSGVDPAGAPRSVSATVLVAAASNNDSQLAVTGQSGRTLGMQVSLGAAGVLVGAALIGLTVVWRRRSVRGV